MARRSLHCLAALALVALPSPALAYTQWAAAITLGGGGRLTPEDRREGLFTLGLRADVLFGPRDPFSARAGPFVAAWTDDFVSLLAAAGASLLVPTSTTTPFVLSAGAIVSATERQHLPVGVMGRVWWGSRSLNYHSSYGMAAGLWVETRYMPDAGTVDVIAGIDGDLAFLSIPAVLFWNWITR